MGIVTPTRWEICQNILITNHWKHGTKTHTTPISMGKTDRHRGKHESIQIVYKYLKKTLDAIMAFFFIEHGKFSLNG